MDFMRGDELLRWAETARPGDSIVYGRGERAPGDVVAVIASLSSNDALHPTRRRLGDIWAFQAQRGSGKIGVKAPRRGPRGLPARRHSDRAVFKLITAAAKRGLMCPTNAQIAKQCGLSGAVSASYRVRRLCAQGKISVVDHSPYGRRIVTILVGPYSGAQTREAAI